MKKLSAAIKQEKEELDVGYIVTFVFIILFGLLLCFGNCRCQIQINTKVKDKVAKEK